MKATCRTVFVSHCLALLYLVTAKDIVRQTNLVHPVPASEASKNTSQSDTFFTYALPGNVITIPCNFSIAPYVNETYVLQIFKDRQSVANVLYTYLHMPSHEIAMPVNGWKDRNVTAYFTDYPSFYLPNVSSRDEVLYICALNVDKRAKPLISRTKLKVL